uniref:NDRG family member 2 n=1 Tax=Astyanax mexicanus TaxID=7994 RepID=W5KP27_ASTMX
MTTAMQEIAITEDKPLLTGQPDAVKEAEIAARILLDQGQEHSIETPHGLLHVTLHGTGNTRRPAILTFHDLGMERYQYASMDQLAEMIPAVLQYFFRSVIGVGVGAGAYILSRFTLSNPDSVEGLVLVNIDPNARGWMDWAAQKISTLTSSLTEQILSHLFSQEELSANTELVQSHRDRLTKAPNLINMELFFKSYSRRDLNIDRNSTLCPVMLVVGDQAPYEEAVECNSKLDPTTTSFLKMADAGGMPQLTQPSKLTEAFKYFIQGMGYASSCMTRLSRSRTTSLSSSYSMEGSRSRSRTLSQGSQGGNLPPSPSNTMEVSC